MGSPQYAFTPSTSSISTISMAGSGSLNFPRGKLWGWMPRPENRPVPAPWYRMDPRTRPSIDARLRIASYLATLDRARDRRISNRRRASPWTRGSFRAASTDDAFTSASWRSSGRDLLTCALNLAVWRGLCTSPLVIVARSSNRSAVCCSTMATIL